MVRLQVGYWLVACSVLGCGESSSASSSSDGGSGNLPGGGSAASESGSSALGGAAGSTSDFAPYFEPGSRLKPKVLASDDGVDVLEVTGDAAWYDSELEFDCFFVPDEAGVERCFPRDALTGRIYADADCTRRVLDAGAVAACGGLRSKYFFTDEGGCTFRGFRLGEELPASTPLFISTDGTSCQPSAQAELGPIYEVEAMPAETFVGMQRGPRARAPGLDAYVREGDDGSWQILGYFDPARAAACFDLFVAFDPPSKCVPAHASASWFADSTCQTRIADAQLRSCNVEQPTALIATQLDTSSCPTSYSFDLYEVDDIREVERYEVDSGACVVSTTPPAESYVQGAAIDASTLPTLETLIVGTGATRALFTGFGGVPYMPAWYGHTGLLDESGDACAPRRFPDGSLRCIPTSFPFAVATGFVYEDASCSGPPAVPWIAKPTCPADPPLPRGVLISDQTSQCELSVAEIVEVVGQSSADVLYTKDVMTGACRAVPSSSPSPTYLRLGASLEAAEFAELERTIRP